MRRKIHGKSSVDEKNKTLLCCFITASFAQSKRTQQEHELCSRDELFENPQVSDKSTSKMESKETERPKTKATRRDPLRLREMEQNKDPQSIIINNPKLQEMIVNQQTQKSHTKRSLNGSK